MTDKRLVYRKVGPIEAWMSKADDGNIDERHWILGQAYIVGGWGNWGQKELDGYRTDYTVILRNCTLKMQNGKITAICVKE